MLMEPALRVGRYAKRECVVFQLQMQVIVQPESELMR